MCRVWGQLHGRDSSECDWTSGHWISHKSIAYTCTTQELWVRPSQSMVHTGWSAHAASHIGESTLASFIDMLLVAPIAVARTDLSLVKCGDWRHEPEQSTSLMATTAMETIHGPTYSVSRVIQVTAWKSVDPVCHCCLTHSFCEPFLN